MSLGKCDNDGRSCSSCSVPAPNTASNQFTLHDFQSKSRMSQLKLAHTITGTYRCTLRESGRESESADEAEKGNRRLTEMTLLSALRCVRDGVARTAREDSLLFATLRTSSLARLAADDGREESSLCSI